MATSRVRSLISHDESMVESLMKFFIIIMWNWYTNMMILFTVTGWLKLYCLYIRKCLMFQLLCCQISAKVYEAMSIMYYVHRKLFMQDVWKLDMKNVHKSLKHIHIWIHEHMNHAIIWVNNMWIPSLEGSYWIFSYEGN